MMNCYSGFAISAGGLMKKNILMVMAGALVASSGAILSYIMCQNMSRSLFNIMIGADAYSQKVFNRVETSSKINCPYIVSNSVTKISNIDLINELIIASDIIIVPGYGLAQSNSHFLLADLIKFLGNYCKKIRICIHPMAGRMPGHMNALLDEAGVNYKIVNER